MVHKDHPVADLGIMADMGARHDQHVIAHARHTATAFGAKVHGRRLADAAALANGQTRPLAPVFQILRHLAHRGEGKDRGVFANLGPARHHGVAFHHHPVVQRHLGADQAERTDLAARADHGARFDHGTGMDAGLGMDGHGITPWAGRTWQ